MKRLHIFLLFFLIFDVIVARRHHLEVKNDVRPYIALSTFGFYMNGRLSVKFSNFKIDNESDRDLFGLALDKTTIDQMNPYLESHQNTCLIEEPSANQRSGQILFFLFDLKNLNVRVQCSLDWQNQHIYKDSATYRMYRGKRQSSKVGSIFLHRKRRDTIPHDDFSIEQDVPEENEAINLPPKQTSKGLPATAVKSTEDESIKKDEAKTNSKQHEDKKASLPIIENKMEYTKPELNPAPLKHVPVETLSIPNEFNYQLCKSFVLPLEKKVINGQNYYNMSFYMLVETLHDEGLYNLYFHACPNYRGSKAVTFNVDIEESNNGNYLSAGEMPLPALYFMMSILFFLSGLFWVFLLKKSTYNVYKIHYIMAILVFLKSLSLMFHAINFHFIETRGEHVEAWAILYYVTHLLKGAVLFITIVLIGTGWTFIKHILSDKDKKIFMIVIPLQVLANVAEIIIDESEESDIEFRTWRNIFIFVDLLCCGAILFPIVWSIRHLHEASATDGKAAINLRKLKLFRQFYIMIVCYIYFTRIIVYLLKMTVAFQYAWLDEMFHEMATYVFFVLTGYKFRPESAHPYFTVADDDDDEVEVLTESGLTEGLHRTHLKNRNAPPSKTKIIEGNDEEYENLIIKRESSHEYD